MQIQKYLRPHVAYTNRIRPSTRIRFVSGHLKGLVNRACALRLVLILWRQRVQKYTDTSVHTYPDTQRIQKFPLWRAYTEISGYTERIRRTRVDARCIRMKKIADTKISGYVWTGSGTEFRVIRTKFHFHETKYRFDETKFRLSRIRSWLQNTTVIITSCKSTCTCKRDHNLTEKHRNDCYNCGENLRQNGAFWLVASLLFLNIILF